MKRDRPHPSPFPGRKKTPEGGGAPIDLATFKKRTSQAPRQHADDAPTIAPPKSERSLDPNEIDITVQVEDDVLDPFDLESLPVGTNDARPTLTNEVELETARLQSVVLSSLPPPRESNPSMESPLLSMANAQAPTVPPPRDYESAKMSAAAPIPTPNASRVPDELSSAATGEGKSVDPIVEMRDRHSLGDFTGALQLAEQILEDDPTNPEVLRCAEACREVLVKMYTGRLGPLDRVPIILVPRHQLRWLSIDHRAGFVLSHIDGTSSLEMILDVSGMPPLDALRILYELVQQKIVGFR